MDAKVLLLGDVCVMKEVNATKTCEGIHVWKKIFACKREFRVGRGNLGKRKFSCAHRARYSIVMKAITDRARTDKGGMHPRIICVATYLTSNET